MVCRRHSLRAPPCLPSARGCVRALQSTCAAHVCHLLSLRCVLRCCPFVLFLNPGMFECVPYEPITIHIRVIIGVSTSAIDKTRMRMQSPAAPSSNGQCGSPSYRCEPARARPRWAPFCVCACASCSARAPGAQQVPQTRRSRRRRRCRCVPAPCSHGCATNRTPSLARCGRTNSPRAARATATRTRAPPTTGGFRRGAAPWTGSSCRAAAGLKYRPALTGRAGRKRSTRPTIWCVLAPEPVGARQLPPTGRGASLPRAPVVPAPRARMHMRV